MNHVNIGCAPVIFILSILIGAKAPYCRSVDDYAVESASQPYRAAVKIGSPDLVGLEVEGIIPGMGDWLGIWVGATYLPIGRDSEKVDGVVTEEDKGGLNHFGIGTNLYLTGGGSGVFASMGYDRVAAYTTILKTQTNKKSFTNPTHLFSLELGYKYIGTHYTYGLFGGYGLNFAYSKPEVDDKPLFNKGNWILAGMSFGIALPFLK